MKDFKNIKWWLIGGVVLFVGVILYARKGESFKKGNKKSTKTPKKILFVGDSITAIKNYKNNSAITYTYPNFVKKSLEPKGISVDVLAKGGETTAWMAKNLPDYLKDKKFDRIYIQGGSNDAINQVPYEKFVANVNKMIDAGKSNGAEVFFVPGFDHEKTIDKNKLPTTVYVPTKEGMYKRYQIWFGWQKKIEKEFANKADGIVPMFELDKSLTADGIHPSLKGAEVFAQKIIETI